MEGDRVTADPSRDGDGDVLVKHEFPDDHSVQATPEYQPLPVTDFIEQLMASTAVHKLEAAVKIGNQLLDDIKVPLAAVADNHAESAAWLRSIQQVQESAKPGRAVVGVV